MKKRITYIIILLLTISLIFVSYKYYQSINSNIEIKYQNELLSELYKLSKEDERIIEIIDHHEEYPNTLLYMLSRDLDMLDFVIDFPKNNKWQYIFYRINTGVALNSYIKDTIDVDFEVFKHKDLIFSRENNKISIYYQNILQSEIEASKIVPLHDTYYLVVQNNQNNLVKITY